MQKKIKEILKNLDIIEIFNNDLLEKKVSGIKYNSKEIQPYDIFICLEGQHTNGVFYIEEAIKRGAIGIVFDKKINFKFKNVVGILVKDAYDALAKISLNFYENPSSKMLVIGVTGTNGKTTVTYLLESIFKEAGFNPAVIGTINYRYNNKIFEAKNTTPFSSDLQKLLYDMYKTGVNVVIMEVSSHALAQKRVEGCEFDVAIFTNLSQEHLDYHKTMEEYFKVKSKLFMMINNEKKEIFRNSTLGKKVCIINYDDEWGKKLYNLCLDKEVFLYCKGSKNNNGRKKFKAINIKYSTSFTEFEIVNDKLRLLLKSELLGEFNVYNILAAFSCAYSQKLPIEAIINGIKKVKNIPGRLQKITTPNNLTVVIDYAHTPDALQKVITTLKSLPHKRLIVVFGCGGDRDRSKRPLMGAVACSLADYVIVTSDNPRSEDPHKIILDIEVGIKKIGRTNYEIVVDRKEAIFKALSIAKEQDIVLLAGKGHENYQIIGENKIYFNEVEIVNEFFIRNSNRTL